MDVESKYVMEVLVFGSLGANVSNTLYFYSETLATLRGGI